MRSKEMSFAQLKRMLRMMEADLGMTDLSQDEKDILAAVFELRDANGYFESDSVRSHELTSSVSHGTFFRALRSLVERGLIEKGEGRQRKLYRLSLQAS